MKITGLAVRDVRFPTARERDGSDALNQGDYSATYVVLRTDQHPKFTLYNTVVFVCVFNYFLAYDNVLL